MMSKTDGSVSPMEEVKKLNDVQYKAFYTFAKAIIRNKNQGTVFNSHCFCVIFNELLPIRSLLAPPDNMEAFIITYPEYALPSELVNIWVEEYPL